VLEQGVLAVAGRGDPALPSGSGVGVRRVHARDVDRQLAVRRGEREGEALELGLASLIRDDEVPAILRVGAVAEAVALVRRELRGRGGQLALPDRRGVHADTEGDRPDHSEDERNTHSPD
jgi:hypothetical protein